MLLRLTQLKLQYNTSKNKKEIYTYIKIPLYLCYSNLCPYLPPKHNPQQQAALHVVLSTDMAGQLDVFRHYGHMLSMYSIQVGIFQEAGQIVFSGLLQHLDHAHLEVQIMCSIGLCYVMYQAHKRPLLDEELGTLLVLMYLVESHCP